MANTNTEHAPVTLDSLIALAGAAGQDAVKPEQETAGCDNCTTCDCESTIPPDAEAPEVASPVVAEAVASAEDENQEPISIDFVQAVDQRPRGNRRAAPVNPAMAEKLASALLSTNAAVAAAAEQTVAEAVRQATDAPATVRADRPNQKSKRRQRPDVAVAPAPDATAVPQATQQRTWLWSRGEHRKLLEAVIHRFDGGPVGLDNIAASIGEEAGTIEDVIEPYLIQQGFLQRTPRGRVATLAAYRHLGVAAPQGAGGLFGAA